MRDVSNQSKIFGMIVDGTQNIQGKEQQSISVRHVSDMFDIKEEFLGLYNVDSTSGEAICATILDALNQATVASAVVPNQGSVKSLLGVRECIGI